MSDSLRIDNLIMLLRTEGIDGVDGYEQNLRANADNEERLHDLSLEARAALMFRQYHWWVRLRGKSPDLELRFGEELVYAEVKHFRRKKQDQRDEEAMSAAHGELVPYGDLTKDAGEGYQTAWQQLFKVMSKKEKQCVEGYPNILVVESSSESMELMALSAVNAYDKACQSGQCCGRFNGLMFVEIAGWSSLRRGNVAFCRTAHPKVPLSGNLTRALEETRWESS